jgi:hypothetical protein
MVTRMETSKRSPENAACWVRIRQSIVWQICLCCRSIRLTRRPPRQDPVRPPRPRHGRSLLLAHHGRMAHQRMCLRRWQRIHLHTGLLLSRRESRGQRENRSRRKSRGQRTITGRITIPEHGRARVTGHILHCLRSDERVNPQMKPVTEGGNSHSSVLL